MNFLIPRRLEPKLSAFGRRFVYSLPIAENPSIFSDQNVKISDKFNPFVILKDPKNPRNFNLKNAKIIHAHLLRTHDLYSDMFITNSLLDCYFRCGNISYAFYLFDEIPEPNTVSWNLMLSGCNKTLFFEESWMFFCRMHRSGLEMGEYTYGSAFSACGALECVMWGEQIYGLSVKNGFFPNGYVRVGMMDLFSESSRFDEALRVFYDVPCENVACWNAIISGAVKNMEYWVALDFFSTMCRRFLVPNEFTISSVVTACAAIKDLDFGRGVQGWMIKCGVKEDVFLGTAILGLYVKSGDMDDAARQFWLMPVRNVVSWTAMISGFAQNGDFFSAVEFFKTLRNIEVDINQYTITSVLMACANPDAVKEAIQIHCWIFKAGFCSDSVVKASLINMYSKIGAIDSSERLFQETGDMKHLGTYGTMISALAQNKNPEQAIYLFQQMLKGDLKPDKFCTSSVLGITNSLNLGRQIHTYTVKTGLLFGVSVGCSLFTMYSKCGSLEESYSVFSLLEGKDTISWASMIAGFVQNGSATKAIHCFREMLSEEIVPDEMTLTAILTACSALCLLRTGKEVHGFSLRNYMGRQISIGSALVNMYSKCGILGSARRVFDMIPRKDQFMCSALVSGYAQSGYTEEAIHLFRDMLVDGVDIDDFTVSSVLGSVADVSRLGLGSQIHALVIKMELESEVSVGSSLLVMYSKIGSIEDCHKAFQKIKTPDVISWTALIASYAQHGKGTQALKVYELMIESGINPDSVTFVAVLSACSHSGLIEEGYFHFSSMKDYGIEPAYIHYSCMVDLLGRAGRLKDAEKFITSMPITSDALVWGTLLAACKVHGDVDLGKLAAEKIMELETREAGTYVSLANICADMGQWDDVLKLRSEMTGTGVIKEPGWSSV
ncbi:hypothetical protein ACH5RR_007697 [Cinchona calisaya]|uniref:Pentatricopeptide repeat-containing protein n=1 Tax=Cinchona calisaya TaxID=153742 RepID=A0ABD3AD43_9GENT